MAFWLTWLEVPTHTRVHKLAPTMTMTGRQTGIKGISTMSSHVETPYKCMEIEKGAKRERETFSKNIQTEIDKSKMKWNLKRKKGTIPTTATLNHIIIYLIKRKEIDNGWPNATFQPTSQPTTNWLLLIFISVFALVFEKKSSVWCARLERERERETCTFVFIIFNLVRNVYGDHDATEIHSNRIISISLNQ